MGLKIKYDDSKNINIEGVKFNIDDSQFNLVGNLENDKSIEIEIDIDYELEIDSKYNVEDYEVHIIKGSMDNENDIFQVFHKSDSSERDIRMGWIFPIQSLMSKEHSQHDNPHFLPYAYIAYEILLRNKNGIQNEVPIYQDGYEYNLNDFYNENSIVLVLCKANISKVADYNIDDYLPYLYKYGYVFNQNPNRPFISPNRKGEIKLKRMSPYLRNEGFIVELFKTLLGTEGGPLVRFYLLYQVIELLIDKVFNNEFKSLVSDLDEGKNSLFTSKDKLTDMANEKSRIRKLFTNYTKIEVEIDLIIEMCKKLLESVDKKLIESEKENNKEHNLATNLYKVRNLLVHNYRAIDKDDRVYIDEINKLFEEVLIDLLITYNEL